MAQKRLKSGKFYAPDGRVYKTGDTYEGTIPAGFADLFEDAPSPKEKAKDSPKKETGGEKET